MEKEIEYLENLVQVKESEISKLKAAIQVLKGTSKMAAAAPIQKPKVKEEPKQIVAEKTKQESVPAKDQKPKSKTVKKRKYKPRKKKTIKDLVLMSLKDGKPKTKLEILEYVRKTKGASYSASLLSPQLSSLMKTSLKKTHIKSDNTSNQFYYGLNDWFAGDQIMDKYVDILKTEA